MGKKKRIILKFEEEPVELNEIVEKVLAKHSKLILEYKAGIRSSLTKLIREVAKECEGKVDPKKVKNLILQKI